MKVTPSLIPIINKGVLELLGKVCGNFKFLVNTIISENSINDENDSKKSSNNNNNNNNQLSSVSRTAALWNLETDGMVVVEWGNDSISCSVNVCGILI